MLYSDKYKFIFIHIPKTGGSSIRRCLKDNILDARRMNGGTHTTIREVRDGVDGYTGKFELAKIGLDSDKFHNYFSFAFVRNPWDRAVSIVADDLRKKKELITKEKFKRLLMEMSESRLDTMSYLMLEGSVGIDTIYDFDHINEEFTILIRDIHTHSGIYPIVYYTLPHIRNTEHKHYSYYYDLETIDKIARCEGSLIGLFHYRFEDKK